MERHIVDSWLRPGTLVRSPLSGEAPRPILQDVQDADWAPDGTNIAYCLYRAVFLLSRPLLFASGSDVLHRRADRTPELYQKIKLKPSSRDQISIQWMRRQMMT
jgi:hypothetical protein